MNPLPITHSATSHPHPHRQGPLDNTWLFIIIVVVVHHRHHCLPLPPSLPSWGWLLLGAACRHCHPHPCHLPPPQPYQQRISATSPSFSSPPRHPLAFSPLSITHGAILDRHAASTPSGTMRRLPLPPAPPLSKDGTIAPAPPSRPPRCLGLLSGGWRWIFLRFSGRRRRSGNGDGSTLTLPLVPSTSGAVRMSL